MYDTTINQWGWIGGPQGFDPLPPFAPTDLDAQWPIHRVEPGFDVDDSGSKYHGESIRNMNNFNTPHA